MTSKWFVTQIVVYAWGTTLLDLLREVMTRTRKMGPLRMPLVGEPSHLERCHPPAFHYVLAVDVSVFCVEIWHIGWKHGAEKTQMLLLSNVILHCLIHFGVTFFVRCHRRQDIRGARREKWWTSFACWIQMERESCPAALLGGFCLFCWVRIVFLLGSWASFML